MSATSITEANRQLVAEMYTAIKRGDIDGFFAPLAPDVVVNEPRFLPYGGSYRGVNELKELLGRVSGIFDISGMKIEALIADEDHVIGLIRAPLIDSSGEIFLAEISVIRDGRVIEMHIFVHDAASLLRR
jgi:uncharacterized protein